MLVNGTMTYPSLSGMPCKAESRSNGACAFMRKDAMELVLVYCADYE